MRSSPENVTQERLESVVRSLSAHPEVDALLIQLPLPKHLNEERALLAVNPDKDVDGLHPVNLGRLVMGAPGPLPCTPAGIVELLHAYDVPVSGKHVVIVGRGLTIGRPLALLLALKRPGLNAAVTVVHTGVADLGEYVRQGDIVVAAAGWANLVTRDMVEARRSSGRRRGLTRGKAPALRRRGIGRRGRGLDNAPDRWGRAHDEGDAAAQRRARGRTAGVHTRRGLRLTRRSGTRSKRHHLRRRASLRLGLALTRVGLSRLACMSTKITMSPAGALLVPDEPISPTSRVTASGSTSGPPREHVLDAAAAKHGKHIAWKEVLAGEKAFKETGSWLPEETVEAFRDHLIGIKGPLTTPVGGGFRSLNVALRQLLDLYVCLRPVRWFAGRALARPPPREGRHGDLPGEHRGRLRRPRARGGYRRGAASSSRACSEELRLEVRADSGIGIKPISETGSKRLVRAALQYAVPTTAGA